MWYKENRAGWIALDDAASKAGGYVAKPDYQLNGGLKEDIRAMSEYCQEKGITPMELTDEEYAMFLYESPTAHADGVSAFRNNIIHE